jgi:hypothetical protein
MSDPGATKAVTSVVKSVSLLMIATQKTLGWAEVYLRLDRGHVMIVSDFGNWSYVWPLNRLGGKTLCEFLVGVGRDYAGRKFLGSKYRVYDHDATVQCVRARILEERRDDGLSASIAKEEFELLWLLDERGFDSWAWETTFSDPCDFRRETVDTSWLTFWEEVWDPVVRPALEMQVQFGTGSE